MALAERSDVAPYALVVIDDIVWYNESGQRPDALVRFDPKTEKFQSWAIPVRRRHHPPHAGDAGRQHRHSPEQLEPRRSGDDRKEAVTHDGR